MEGSKKVYDLEERTFEFARDIRLFVRKLEVNTWNKEDIKQVVRSSGSVAANYIEANEKLGEKDLLIFLPFLEIILIFVYPVFIFSNFMIKQNRWN